MEYKITFLFIVIFSGGEFQTAFAQNGLTLTIATQAEINFWEPLEFSIVFENRRHRKKHLTLPPICKVEFRKQGTEEWTRVQVNTSFGPSWSNTSDLYLREKGDSLLLQYLLAPVPYQNSGLKKEYYFKPNENYEFRYSYQLEYGANKGYSHVVYGAFSTTGTYDSEDYILMDNIDDPIFLFYPSTGFYDREEKKEICQTILAQGGSTLSKWAEYYLLFWYFFEKGNRNGKEELSTEEQFALYEELKTAYFDYLEKVDSDFIRESFRRQHYYYFWKGPGTKLFENLPSAYGF